VVEGGDGHKITALPARVVLSGAKERAIDGRGVGSDLRAEPGASITVASPSCHRALI